MNAIKYLDRLKQINELIKNQSTGTPKELSQKLSISESHLYRCINEMKEMGVPVDYCRRSSCYYYTTEFDLKVSYSIQLISEKECRKISGGFSMKKSSLLFYESGR
ncbi:HTH domain-containing protein [Marinifilum fragile]|uniref:HTH domain-containing protein n=1 Tax=Marinifilum fragile TaxID=570161 RepID=UPI002AA79EBD|nr:HTH domain-containing protein [Marinifilum fragile]